MTSRVTTDQELSLNGVRYHLKGKVRSTIASTYPEKRITGDFTRDSQRNVSVLSISDQSGGIGRQRMIPGETNRSWYSKLNLRRRNHLTLPALSTQTAAVTSGSEILVNEVSGAIVICTEFVGGFTIEEYSTGGDSWTVRSTGSGILTDVSNGMLGTTEYCVFALTSGYSWASSPASWTLATKDAKFVEFWDDRFWGIDATGQLWYTFTMGSTEINDAQLRLERNDSITCLFTGRDASGEVILYVSTIWGLYAHDVGGRRFVKTGVTLANVGRITNGKAALTWRDNIYLISEFSILEYRPGSDATVRPMGFDLDDGGGQDLLRASCLGSSVNELLVGVRSFGGSADSGVYSWDSKAWQLAWISPGVAQDGENIHVSNIVSYRMWISTSGPIVHFSQLETGALNSNVRTGYEYQNGELRHEYALFDADQKEITKIALTLKVEVEGASSTEYVKVFVDFDGAGYSQLTDTHTNDSTFNAANDRIQGPGSTKFSFPSVSTPAGTEFRTLQIAVDLDRGGTNTLSPDVISITLEYLKVLDEKLAFDFELDVNEDYGDKTPQELRAAYKTAQASKILVELTYRDDANRNYYVKVLGGAMDEESGYDETGTILVRCEQP